MKNKSLKQLLFLTGCVFIFSVLVHVFGDLSWGFSFGVACLGLYIWLIHEEIESLKTMFFIADAELVRVSALVAEHQEKIDDLERELARANDELSQIK